MAYNGLRKIERLNSTKVIDQLFKGHNGRESLCGSLAAFPLRCVWNAMEIQNPRSEIRNDASVSTESDCVNHSSDSHSSSYVVFRNSDFPPASVLIVAPKKRLRHAVDRNRMKRQIREAYRLNKHILWDAIDKRSEATGKRFTVAVALLCISDTPVESVRVEKAVVKALTRIAEALQKQSAQHAHAATHTIHHD